MSANETVIRNQIADYLNVGTSATEDWVLMGAGFNTLDENPNAQSESKVYINDKAKTSYIKSYEPQFPFDTDLIKSEKAIMALYDVGRNQKTGADAEKDYLRVELFQPVDSGEPPKANTFKARKFRVSVEVSGCAGNGGEAIKVTGNLNNVGTFEDGEFNTQTKTFTPSAT